MCILRQWAQPEQGLATLQSAAVAAEVAVAEVAVAEVLEPTVELASRQSDFYILLCVDNKPTRIN